MTLISEEGLVIPFFNSRGRTASTTWAPVCVCVCVCVCVDVFYPHCALIQGVLLTSLGHGRAVASPDGHLVQCPAGNVSCISHSLLDVVPCPQAQLPELRERRRHLTNLPAIQQVTQGHAAGGEGRGGEGRGGEGRGGEG